MGTGKFKVILYCVLCAIALVFISACGGGGNESSSESAAAEMGTVAVSVLWKGASQSQIDTRAAMAEPVNCATTGIAKILINVYDENDQHLKGGGPWDCEKRSGIVSGVKTGENRTVAVIGNDASGQAVYRGEATGVTIGTTTEVVEIEFNPFTPTLTNPVDETPVVYGAFQFQWRTVADAIEYQIQVSTDSGFQSTLIDEPVQPSTYQPETPLPAGTCYWRVKSKDRHNRESGWSEVRSFNILQGHTATFSAGDNGSLSGETTQSVPHDSDCAAVTAIPDTGYHFTGWSGDITGTDNPLILTNVTSDMNIQANFDINTYTVSFSAGANGSLSGDTSQSITHGSNCATVTANPEPNYHFTGWSGGVSGAENPLTITNVTSNMNIQANFEINTYTVSFSAGANGSLSGDTSQTIPHGSNGTAVTANPDTGYHFTGWSGSITGTENPLITTTVTSDMNIQANFNINNTAPVAEITGPAYGSTYIVGDEIVFAGSGSDSEDGDLINSSLVWSSDVDGQIGMGETCSSSSLSAGNHKITLTATDSENATGMDNVFITVATGYLPDTGQTADYTDIYGEDSDYSINPPTYTKLDEQGNDLDALAKSWWMIKDNVTGLIWDSKIFSDKSEFDWQAARDTFIDQLNNDNYCGYNDWRLPTIKELYTIVHKDKDVDSPAVNTTYFSSTTPSGYYWSSTTSADPDRTDLAWVMDLSSGRIRYRNKSESCYVRAVRGIQKYNSNLVDNGDGTVTDIATGLMWQQNEAGGMTWEYALSYCEELELSNYDDWRLPNAKELQSIIDYGKYDEAMINTTFFPQAEASGYWSSTTDAHNTDRAWYVHFNYGDVFTVTKTYSNNVRAVRGGQ